MTAHQAPAAAAHLAARLISATHRQANPVQLARLHRMLAAALTLAR